MTFTECVPRQGEVAWSLQNDANLYYLGAIYTPWHTRQECP